MENIQVARPLVGDEEIKAAVEVLKSGLYASGSGGIVPEFEGAFADYIGIEHCVAVNSGTAALHLSLIALSLDKKSHIVVPPMTFFATIESVLYVKGIPLFADIDLDTYTLSLDTIKKVKETNFVDAIIPVSLFGMPVKDMPEIIQFAKNHDIKVIEDFAQAHGAGINGQKCGSFADVSCTSFFATKNMTTIEGGMICTDDLEVAEKCRMLRSHGMSDRDTHKYLGYNYRMTELEAAIGIEQLKKLDKFNQIRREISERILNSLEKIEGIKVTWPPKSYTHAYFWCPIVIEQDQLGMTTKTFMEKLQGKNIEARHRYWEPLYRQPILKHFSGAWMADQGTYLKNAEKFCGNFLGLPNHPDLTDEQVKYIINSIKEIVNT